MRLNFHVLKKEKNLIAAEYTIVDWDSAVAQLYT